MRSENPFEGRWQCSSCGRTFGRHFTQCGYCPFGKRPQTTQAAPQAPRPTPHVGRPAGGVTGRVWAILDGLGAAATLPALLAKAAEENINESTARTQFSRWKKSKAL